MNRETHRNNRFAGILYAVAAFTLWGFLPLYWKIFKPVPAGEILAHRILWSFVFVFVMLGLWGRLKDLRHAICNRSNLTVIFLSALLISANWFIYIWAINNNHVVESSLGYYINPLFNVLLGVVV